MTFVGIMGASNEKTNRQSIAFVFDKIYHPFEVVEGSILGHLDLHVRGYNGVLHQLDLRKRGFPTNF